MTLFFCFTEQQQQAFSQCLIVL